MESSPGREKSLTKDEENPGLDSSLDPTETLFRRVDDKTVVTSTGIKITLCTGGIQAQEVDVIVNSTSKNIDNKSGGTAAILREGGPGLKAEIKKCVPLNFGTIKVTSGHKLSCKNLYHARCGGWDGPNGNCQKYIKQIVAQSFKTAAQSGHSSIAIPAIGTGKNNVPSDKCAEMLFNEVAMMSYTSVDDVRFVIYDKDKETIKAFETEMSLLADPPSAGLSRMGLLGDDSLKPNIGIPLDATKSDFELKPPGHGMEDMMTNSSGLQVTLGTVELQLEIADITQESTDAIINSTNINLDLTIGGVAQALAKAGGEKFVRECKDAVMVDGVVITSGGNLRAQHVIHIAAPRGEQEWKKVIEKTIYEAEKNRFKSVTFPALGTGQLQSSGSTMASIMLDSFADFADKKPSSVHLLRIVTHPGQLHILNNFRSEIMKKAVSGEKTSWWASFKDALTKRKSHLDVKVLPPTDAESAKAIMNLDRIIAELHNEIEICQSAREERGKNLPTTDISGASDAPGDTDVYDERIQSLKQELERNKGELYALAPRRAEYDEARAKQVEEERKKEEELVAKRRDKRTRIIEEIIETEQSYLQSLLLCCEVFLGPDAEQCASVDMDTLFGNIDKVVDLSKTLLDSLKKSVGGKRFEEQIVGTCFIELKDDMSNIYGPFCVNYSDVADLLVKYTSEAGSQEWLSRMLDKMREKTNVFELGAVLIKPVQRILKYPLLLTELVHNTEDSHEDKPYLSAAVSAMKDMATAINELKRKKERDLIPPNTGMKERMTNSSGLQVTLGPVELQLELADITQESTDAIVNSTNINLDFTKGGVAQALAKAGGDRFVRECKEAVMVDGVVITSGGNLIAHHVIHIAAPLGAQEWKKVIVKSIEEAEQRGYTSVTFPALGTGQLQVSGSKMASIMLDTFADFADTNPSNVHLVRIVIHPGQPHILNKFRKEIMKKAAYGEKTSWWGSFKDALSGRKSQFAVKVLPPSDTENANAIKHLDRNIIELQNEIEICQISREERSKVLSTTHSSDVSDELDDLDVYDDKIKCLKQDLDKTKEALYALAPQRAERAMAAQLKAEAKAKQKEEERKKEEELVAKRRNKRTRIIEEIIETEQSYLQSLLFCCDVFLGPNAEQCASVDVDTLFGNIDQVVELSKTLLDSLEKSVGGKQFEEQIVGTCFIDLKEDMINKYGLFCANHNEAVELIVKYNSEESTQQWLSRMSANMKEKTKVFELGDVLIKPVQRILKYDLLLTELFQNTEDSHEDKPYLLTAVNAMTDVANAINELKTKKDLILKYKMKNEDTLRDKWAKLNLHSTKNKFSRLNQIMVDIQTYHAENCFSARGPGEINLEEGQMVRVLQKRNLEGNGDWWLLEIDGKQGYAPASYLYKAQ